MAHLQGGNSMSRIKEILFWVVALGFTVGFIIGFRALTTPPEPAIVAVTTTAPVPSEPAGEPSPPEDAPSIDDAALVMAENEARLYLNVAGFSRDGLINQLVMADGYPQDIATQAVDSLDVDWNEQAVRVATQWAESGSPYTRDGLVQELMSEYTLFTQVQAEYAADEVGF
jgi:hypothetical protein